MRLGRKTLWRCLIVLASIALLVAACGGGDSSSTQEETAAPEAEPPAETVESDDGDAVTGAVESDDGGSESTGTVASVDQNADQDEPSEPPDDDFAEISGNPDLDISDLPEDAAAAAQEVAEGVSIGACEAVGLRATAPEGWKCRVIDDPTALLDGFTMFAVDNDLEITISAPMPVGSPCELMGMCDEAQPIVLSDNFPDTILLDVFGMASIEGTHVDGEAVVYVSKPTALTEEEVEFVATVLDSIEPS